jgi:hypothetical protein
MLLSVAAVFTEHHSTDPLLYIKLPGNQMCGWSTIEILIDRLFCLVVFLPSGPIHDLLWLIAS